MSPSATVQQDTPVEPSPSDTSPERLRTDPRMLAHVRRLSQVSEWRGIAAIAVEWLVILTAIVFWLSLPASLGFIRWVLYVPVVIAIASRQHSLLILMHEGAHHRLSRNRAWNNFAADMFCSFPVAFATDLYRQHHFQHHQFTNTAQDPDLTDLKPREDWTWPKDHIHAIGLFLSDFIGLSTHKMAASMMLFSPPRNLFYKRKLNLHLSDRLRAITFGASVVAVLWANDLWLGFFMFWLVPYFTALPPIIRMRMVAEHMVLESEHELNKSRSVEATLLERWVIAPLNVHYHLTHHLYPSIPFYNLPEMQRILMTEEVFRDHAHLTRGYLDPRHGVWAEITRPTKQLAKIAEIDTPNTLGTSCAP
jgi:fatty acid desaturase